jgi:glutamate--cysteine ligase catalytic subunit
MLKQGDPSISDRLAQHVAKLFARDPIPGYEGEFMEEQINDNDWTAHFENL